MSDGTAVAATRRLGADGPEVSVLGLGCNNFGWRIDDATSGRVVDAALDAGVTLFDTADVYGAGESERFLGTALGARRDGVVLVTKFGLSKDGAPAAPPGSPEHLAWAIDGSLRRLRTDVVDVYLYHRPDGVTPIDETVGAMARLVQEGKVRALGISNAGAAVLREAAAAAEAAGVPFVATEDRYSLLRREAEEELLPACRDTGVGLLPFYPLESGLLTGKYRRDVPPAAGSRFAEAGSLWPADRWMTPAVFDRVEALERFAAERDLSLLEVALGAVAATSGVASVIAGATSAEQVRANASAVRWRPTAEDRAVLAGL